jgi:hypothetical protein
MMVADIVFSGSAVSLGTVNAALFGGNVLIDRDRFGDGTFDDAARAIGLTALRYPGGTVTERYFDMTDPDRSSVTDPETGEDVELLALSDFLAGASDLGLGVCLVLPTRILLAEGAAGTRLPLDSTFEVVRSYVTDVLNGVYGPARIDALEIGNEYWLGGEMDVTEYARLASVMAEAAQAAIDALAELAPAGWREPEITVQVGQYGAWSTDPGWVQNAFLMDALSDGAASAIDAVAAHYYAAGAYDALPAQGYLFDRLAEWEANPRFAGIETHITEWNVDMNTTVETGMQQASALLYMMSEMVIARVDAAFVWPVQQNAAVTLSDDEGDADLRIAGGALRLLSESVPGMDLMARTEFDGGAAYLYQQGGESVLLLASRSMAETTVALDFAAMGLAGQAYRVGYLGTEGNSATPTAAPALTLDATVQIAGDTGQFDLGAFGVLRIEMAEAVDGLSEGPLIGTSGADTITGSRLDDIVDGGGGADVIRGGHGADTLDGGSGDDVVWGGAGMDRLLGGAGDDRLEGGNGADDIIGGTGDDTLLGGAGSDRLFGDDGADMLKGNSGADWIDSGKGDDTVLGGSGNDHVVDGGGADYVRLGSGDDWFEDSTLPDDGADRVHGGSGDDTIIARAGDDRLYGADGADHIDGGAGADVLKGGMGADTLRGGSGDDRLEGGDGADCFVFGAADGTDVLIDFGADDVIRIEGGLTLDDVAIEVLESGSLRLSFAETVVTLKGVPALPDASSFDFI